MNHIRLTVLALLGSCSLMTASAQSGFFVGVPLSSEMTSEGSTTFIGAQVGTFGLGSGFGLRASLELLPPISAEPSFQAAGDLLFGSGENTIFYVGAGGGYAAIEANEALFVSGTVGLELDAASLISLFLEAQPRYDLTNESASFYLRYGLNFHFGR